jgi:glycosyltransferase involved in cell wall biosynthesis
LKVAVDARELAGRPTGVGRYLSELLHRWAQSDDAQRHEWRFFAHQTVALPPAFARSLSILPGHGGWRWEQSTLSRALRRDKPDVLFAPGYSAPLTTPAPVALTIHDVSFAAHPEWFSFREGFRRRMLTAWSARRARVVLTDSQFSRDEIVKHVGIPASRVRVIPLGLTRRPRGAPTEEREPLVLYVGSIFRRRHVDTLIEVFVNHVAGAVPGSRLEIVGENRLHPPGDPAAVLRHAPPEIAARVAIHSYVDESRLNDVYGRAAVFAFLSEYEGFGLTPLEAMAAGVPAVVLDTSVAREIYGSAARFVSLSSPEPLATALIDLLSRPSARAQLLAHADDVLARYDWDRAAAATLRALEEAAGV